MSAYPAPWFRADVVAGLTTAAVVIPKVMAYGAIAGLPIEIGLYTALIPLVVYAALGTSRATSVTTTSAIASLTAGALQQVAPAGDSAQLIAAAAALTAGVGAALLIASFLKLDLHHRRSDPQAPWHPLHERQFSRGRRQHRAAPA
jgi:MFS superfamily sulfate permease-like transporter